MIREIILIIIMWIFYILGFGSLLIAFYFLFRIVAWEYLKKIFKKEKPSNDKEILEHDPFEE